MATCQHHQCQQTAMRAAEKICADLGARFTQHRRRIFEIVWQSHKALSAADIMQQMENKQPPITYRGLSFLTEHGLVHHIASLNAYVGCLHPEHENHIGQMLICTACRTVTELMPHSLMQKLEEEAHKVEFHPTHTHIEMLGLCQNCHKGAA